MRYLRIPAFLLALGVCTAAFAADGTLTAPLVVGTPSADPAFVAPPSVPVQLPSLGAALRALHTGQPERAAKDLQQLKVMGAVSTAAEGQFLVGRAWLAANKPEFAVLPLRQASRDYDALADYSLFFLGEAYLALERGGPAVEAYERLLVDFPQSVLAPRARLRLADALVAEKQWDRARELYEQVLEAGNSGTTQEELLFRIASALAADGKTDDAANAYFRLWRDHPLGDPAKRAEAELDALAAAGVKVPSRVTTEVRYRRAIAMADSGKPAEAVAAIDALVAAKAKLPGEVRFKRAQLLFKARDYAQSKREFEKLGTSLPAGPERAEAMYWFARSLSRQNEYAAAQKEFEKLRAQYPKLSWSRDALFKEGLMSLEDKDFAAAAKLFDTYGKTYPTASDADESLWYAGWSQYRAKKFSGANATFRLLAERYPRSQLAARARYWTGRAQIAAGQKESGIATLSTVALEESLTYYGLLAAGALADAGVDVPMGGAADGAVTELENAEAGDESPDLADAPSPNAPPDATDEPAVPAPPATYRFHTLRAKTLVRLGFLPEAALELASARGAAVTRAQKLDLARLAMSADYYHGAQNIARLAFADELAKSHGEGEIVRLAYPKAWPRFVSSYAGQYKYSPSMLWAIMREESTYKPDAVSPVGAIGLLQIMPKTGAEIAGSLGVKGFTTDRLFDPEINIGFSAFYVRGLLARFGGNEALAIASYNAGPEAVDRWLKQRGDLALDEFVEEIPYTETRRYVKRVLMSYGVYEALYGAGAPKIRAAHVVAKASLVGAMAALPAPVPAVSPAPIPAGAPAGALAP